MADRIVDGPPTLPDPVKAGEIRSFSSGSYSDYRVNAEMVFRKDCDLEQLASDWLRSIASDLDEFGEVSIDHNAFFAWLIIEEFALPFPVRETHLGDSMEFEVGSVSARPYSSPDAWRLLPLKGGA